MRELFKPWYRPTDAELDLLWSSGLIVLDANVLLAPYRIAASRRLELFQVLEAHVDQLWCPHQAALEFQRNRLKVAADQVQEYERIVKVLDKAENELTQRRRDHPVLDADDFDRFVKRSLSAIVRYVRDVQLEHPDMLGADLQHDVIRDRWDELLHGRVSPALEIDTAWREEADRRYANKTPPGFEDQKRKDEGREYGDLILWSELLDHVKSASQEGQAPVPVMLVTDDGKSDWWRDESGKKLGPHLELASEMTDAGGSPFWMYNVSGFVHEAFERLGWGPATGSTSFVATVPVGTSADSDPDEPVT